MLSGAKHLAFSSGYEVEILRLSPQNDIATQSLAGVNERGAKEVFTAKNAKGAKKDEGKLTRKSTKFRNKNIRSLRVLLCLYVFAACANFASGLCPLVIGA